MISAGAFPPHVTLAGSLPVVVPLAELIQLIGFVLRRRRTFAVQNLGIRRLADFAIAYDVSALDGAPNRPLNDLAGAVDSVVRPLLGPSGTLPPDLYEPDRWLPHISLVSHDLRVRADLREEIEDYVNGLALSAILIHCRHGRCFIASLTTPGRAAGGATCVGSMSAVGGL